ncbi:MAG TPA: hypothetical protein PK404_01835 [Fervidobacterium sp.]|nr:hypothetical protein [Fervidobacterium sp.]HOK87552.1 hypothetical protein [Fervidobacterium sp.]HOM73861.1 hypothetical protein [Fervidobacterium sp.]HPP17546.1 hypothetical protein [Fervidobacterium sp.]HRD20334.1 hypothetical protein [Fervidobacterium sp.]
MKKLGIVLVVVLFGLVAFAQEVDVQALLSRVDILEEYSNMIYDSLGSKVSVDDFDSVISDLDGRLAELETKVLNVQSTIDDGLPALRDMLYELAANVASVEERLSSYVEVSVEGVKEEIMGEIGTAIEDITVTLDIHDTDILKIYETLGMFSDELMDLREMVVALETSFESIESLALKVDMHDQDIVNIYDNLSTKADAEKCDALEASVAELRESIDGLSEIITGLGAQIGDTDYLLRKQIEDLSKIVDENGAKVVELEENSETLLNRIELLEEYANMIYDTTGTKISEDDFALMQQSLDEANAKLEQLEKSSQEVSAKVQQAQMFGIIGIVVGIVAAVVGAMLP